MLKKSLEFNTHTASASFDIYHDNDIVELQKLIPLLGDFSSRISELLCEFPEHPALLQVITLLSFQMQLYLYVIAVYSFVWF